MGGLLGPTGELWEMPCASSLDVSEPERSRFDRTLAGRVVEYQGPPARRTWSVDVGTATPEEASLLWALTRARRRPGRPWWWLSEEAQTSNLLTPATSLGEAGHQVGGVASGPWASSLRVDGTFIPSTVVTDTPRWVGFYRAVGDLSCPVPPDVPYAASVYVTPHAGTTAYMRVDEVGQDGNVLGTYRVNTSGDAAAQRLTLTRTPNFPVVGLRVMTFSALMSAGPAVTLTREALPWAVGAGCDRAALVTASRQVQRATTAVWDRRSAHSYTIQELG